MGKKRKVENNKLLDVNKNGELGNDAKDKMSPPKKKKDQKDYDSDNESGGPYLVKKKVQWIYPVPLGNYFHAQTHPKLHDVCQDIHQTSTQHNVLGQV